MSEAKPRFRPYNHGQNSMVVINYRDQLQPGTVNIPVSVAAPT